jgi:hypothetical protein
MAAATPDPPVLIPFDLRGLMNDPSIFEHAISDLQRADTQTSGAEDGSTRDGNAS